MTRSLLLLLVASLGFAAGCKKKQQANETAPTEVGEVATPTTPAAASQAETPSKPTEKLRGASVVRQDLKRKDYGKAVQGLLGLRAFAVNEAQVQEYRELTSEVTQALSAAAPKDPNAAQALAAYTVAVYGGR